MIESTYANKDDSSLLKFSYNANSNNQGDVKFTIETRNGEIFYIIHAVSVTPTSDTK